METDEVIKLVDNIYKNILEKFNPGARQLISAGKAYLKALHGAAAASRVFNEALAKIAMNAQQGGTTDIGSALMSIVGVYKEIQDQHMNILKAFYVDLLVPLETNLERDTKVVQFEQRKFLQQHKIRADSYSKAAATMKKQRKKKNNVQNTDKEIKSIQTLDEEKNKLDVFCEQSLKNAMTQERRRYGFVLERQCSLAKHWVAYHSSGRNCLSSHLDSWDEVSSSREFLPPNVENMFAKNIKDQYIDDESDRGSIISAIRKTKSIDASCLDMRSLGDVVNSSTMNMPRAKSEFNLTTTATIEPTPKNDSRLIVRALYSYLASGENQLTFHENDRIALVGERAKGWQFGENLRTQLFGWFPVAYTENELEDQNHWSSAQNGHHHSNGQMQQQQMGGHQNAHHPRDHTPDSSLDSTLIEEDEDEAAISSKLASYQDEHSPTRMFGDTIMYRRSKQYRRVSGNGAMNGMNKPAPPTIPAPVPTYGTSSKNQISQSHSFSSNGGPPIIENRKSMPSTLNYSKQTSGMKPKPRSGVTSASLHSSNDSGFANDQPPAQPEVDYSDEENINRVPIRTLKKSRIPRRAGAETQTSTMKSMKSKTSSPQSRHNIRQSTSFGNLTDEQSMDLLYRTIDQQNGHLVKRTKSFWKFGKSDDEILEGMALWQHKDLVQTDHEKTIEREREAATLKRLRHRSLENQTISTNSSETLVNGQNDMHNDFSSIDDRSLIYPITKNKMDERVMQRDDRHEEENIYARNDRVQARSPPPNMVSRAKLVHQYEMERGRERKEENDRNDKYNKKPSKKEQQSQNQRQTRPKSSSKNTNVKPSQQVIKTIEYYDTSDMDTLKKQSRKHDYNRDFEEAPLIINTNSLRRSTAENQFFDDDSVTDVIMKTVKRQEILKQYYSSGTDTERNSASSSDPYDCIVVDDHLVRRENQKNKNKHANNAKMEFKTFRGESDQNIELEELNTSRPGTLLPRTRLTKNAPVTRSNGCFSDTDAIMKSKSIDRRERRTGRQPTKNGNPKSDKQNNEYQNVNESKAYGPWYDLWGQDNSVRLA
ncbi:uncharacterized protein LOC129568401 isoform X2 [Sitodiplosis mosellana]|uniref:uncharacterized protein LOC129568401 isoform X2 n=1 Tax=Sitodiplosis mosellana TaxID=263140 RepID=UPI0024439DD2|nr:uncharacterized protein LOC129568401 isoform X2 [Sitodiplosis mosellana]